MEKIIKEPKEVCVKCKREYDGSYPCPCGSKKFKPKVSKGLCKECNKPEFLHDDKFRTPHCKEFKPKEVDD